MSLAKTQEMQRAFMGGFVAWVIQVALVGAWMFFGSHKSPEAPRVEASTILVASNPLHP